MSRFEKLHEGLRTIMASREIRNASRAYHLYMEANGVVYGTKTIHSGTIHLPAKFAYAIFLCVWFKAPTAIKRIKGTKIEGLGVRTYPVEKLKERLGL